jgi:hypothetical protein
MLSNPGANASPVGSYTTGVWGSLGSLTSVSNGGTGLTSITPNSVLTGGSTSTSNVVPVTPGQFRNLLTSTAGSTINATALVAGTQYSVLSLGTTLAAGFVAVGATSTSVTGTISNGSSAAGFILTVSAGSGLVVGQILSGTGVTANTTITARITGTGGAGTYLVSASQNVTSTTITALNPVFTATGQATGTGTAQVTTWNSTPPSNLGENQSYNSIPFAFSTRYVNSTGKPLFIIVGYGRNGNYQIYINDTNIFNVSHDGNNNNGNALSFIVPVNASYQVNGSQGEANATAYTILA